MKSQRPVQARLGSSSKPNRQAAVVLSVPAEFARHIELGTRFWVEMTEDGILYRPILEGVVEPDVELPSWARP